MLKATTKWLNPKILFLLYKHFNRTNYNRECIIFENVIRCLSLLTTKKIK